MKTIIRKLRVGTVFLVALECCSLLGIVWTSWAAPAEGEVPEPPPGMRFIVGGVYAPLFKADVQANPRWRRSQDDVLELATLLAVPPTLAALEAELPMTQALRQRFFPLVLRGRPPCLALTTPAALLEAFTQVLLGRDLEVWRDQEREHKAGWEWLQRSVTLVRQGHGSTAAHTLYASLCHSVVQKSTAPVAPVMLWGQLMPVPPGPAPKEPGDTVPQTSLPTGTEQRGKAKEQVHRVKLNQQDIDHDVLVHTFEKIETAEEFCGVTRIPDGADELAQHAEALDALDLRDVVRSHTQTRSIYRADVTLDVEVGEVEAAEASDTARSFYDEWDGKARRYKPAWCSVSVTRPTRLTASSCSTYATAVLHKHAKHVRDLQKATQKLLLLISDGKPTDYDRYEGRYGIADVRQAIREAGQTRIHTYALAVDVQAKLYLPEMFGTGNYQILPHPSHLVHSLAQLYTRLWY